MLQPEDFAAFFREVHGVEPFPWQQRLLSQLAGSAEGRWPAVLDLPTGAGKTAAIDIAVFHLALQASRGSNRRAPVRIAFVVDRRLVVDDAHERARRLQGALSAALQDGTGNPVTARVADALKTLAQDGPPLIAVRLRGGVPREDDWARTPSQPTVLCSTVDQVGSRLLFRGYGVSDSMKPVHAGLLGADCLVLLDEAHLAEPFRQTLGWVQHYQGPGWRQHANAAPWGMTLLTATPGQNDAAGFALDPGNDLQHPVLQRRLGASKPARLLLAADEAAREQLLLEEVQAAISAGAQAIGVVLNRVARARSFFEQLGEQASSGHYDRMLLIGPSRPVDRDGLSQALAPIKTGAPRQLSRPLVVVATQCLEAGVDIDLDALFTEAAPLDSLRQRFGRLNRDGRAIEPRAAIVAVKSELGARALDPVYGAALRQTWQALAASASIGAGAKGKARTGKSAQRAAVPTVDFGMAHFNVPMTADTLAEKADAPILMPAHVDLLAHTSPIPAADPDVALYLHGPKRQPDGVSLIWRADIAVDDDPEAVARCLALMPPRTGEAIELPVWTVRRWLARDAAANERLADVPTAEDEAAEPVPRSPGQRQVFRWRGAATAVQRITGQRVRPGDTLVVPAAHGGVDAQGWHPDREAPAVDVADLAARAIAGRRFVVRVAPGLLGGASADPGEQLAERLASVRTEPWKVVRDALLAMPLPQELRQRLQWLDLGRPRRGAAAVEMAWDAYGDGDEARPRGVVFVAPRGLRQGTEPGMVAMPGSASTEDDLLGSAPGVAQSLAAHSAEVEAQAASFAAAAGLDADRTADLRLAGWLHDQGKRDPRFQRWLHHGDPLGADPDDETTVLAKSGRALPPSARDKAGLPPRWRHEALSVSMALRNPRLAAAKDAELVLWLVGSHHGHGRPWFPHADPAEPTGAPGPQSPAFDWNGKDWPTLFAGLRVRYGTWELARYEAILRLADHRASELAANTGDNQ